MVVQLKPDHHVLVMANPISHGCPAPSAHWTGIMTFCDLFYDAMANLNIYRSTTWTICGQAVDKSSVGWAAAMLFYLLSAAAVPKLHDCITASLLSMDHHIQCTDNYHKWRQICICCTMTWYDDDEDVAVARWPKTRKMYWSRFK